MRPPTMAATACGRQLRWRVQLHTDRPDMKPDRLHFNPQAGVDHMRMQAGRGVSVNTPGQSTRGGRKVKYRPLSKGEEEFAATARKELAEGGLSDLDRFNAWMNQDHKKFPDKVKDLRPELKAAVKFGGLNITKEEENLRELYREERRKELVYKRLQEADEENEAISKLGVQVMRSKDPEKRSLEIKNKMAYEKKFNDALARRKELYADLKERVFSGSSDKKFMESMQLRRAEVVSKSMKEQQMIREVHADRYAEKDVRARLEGKDPYQLYKPSSAALRDNPESDISNSAAVIARCILADVPTRGQWPINVPHMARAKFLALQDEAMDSIRDGASVKDMKKLARYMQQSQAQQLANQAWKTHLKGTETGGINNVRDWRNKNPWTFKEQPTVFTDDPNHPLAKAKFLAKATPEERQASAMYDEQTTHAMKPKNRYHSLWMGYNHQLNMRYSKGRRSMESAYTAVGKHVPARVRKNEWWFNPANQS
eukprot:TRINITY_DN32831_c0_g1_i1.p1 TRINITY_DN32831_c0_g1~~TRINITY_DN32831_c0_g1_i1.p1  ORF type:complete len:484 (+),score=151.24 TRINITY_DN32831_c0_g1_i1:72-1523(+)